MSSVIYPAAPCLLSSSPSLFYFMSLIHRLFCLVSSVIYPAASSVLCLFVICPVPLCIVIFVVYPAAFSVMCHLVICPVPLCPLSFSLQPLFLVSSYPDMRKDWIFLRTSFDDDTMSTFSHGMWSCGQTWFLMALSSCLLNILDKLWSFFFFHIYNIDCCDPICLHYSFHGLSLRFTTFLMCALTIYTVSPLYPMSFILQPPISCVH